MKKVRQLSYSVAMADEDGEKPTLRVNVIKVENATEVQSENTPSTPRMQHALAHTSCDCVAVFLYICPIGPTVQHLYLQPAPATGTTRNNGEEGRKDSVARQMDSAAGFHSEASHQAGGPACADQVPFPP